MATFHENLVQSFKNFKDKYLKANGVTFQFSYDSSTGKFGYKDANGNFVPFRKVQASKTVSPSTSSQTVIPDSGYDGIASVTVNAVNLQSKTTTMTPPNPSSWSATTTKLGTVKPDSGYTGLSQAEISIPMVPNNTTLTLQSSGSDYDTYKPSRAGYVFTSSYLRVPKSGGAKYLGEYSADATIDVSELGATSASQFLAVAQNVTKTGSRTLDDTYYNRTWNTTASFTQPTLSLNGNSLTLTVGYCSATSVVVNHETHSVSASNKVKVYFVGDIS